MCKGECSNKLLVNWCGAVMFGRAVLMYSIAICSAQHMLMSCCAYSCTQYSLHTQYMLLTHADDLLCLQLHTVQSPYTVHVSNPCWCLDVPTAAHCGELIFLIFKISIWPIFERTSFLVIFTHQSPFCLHVSLRTQNYNCEICWSVSRTTIAVKRI
jgi:hypothetical protein